MSIDNVIRPRRVRQPGSAASHVVDHVEPLEERQTDDKVQAAAGVGTDVTDNEVNVVSLGPNRCIELQGCLV